MGMNDNRTRMTGGVNGVGGWNYLAAANEDGVSFATRALSKHFLIHLRRSLCTTPTAQG